MLSRWKNNKNYNNSNYNLTKETLVTKSVVFHERQGYDLLGTMKKINASTWKGVVVQN